MKQQRVFTLVELLTAMAIIAVLMGIMLPAIGQVKKKAKISKAKTEIQSIVNAIKLFESTYGYLPFKASELTNAEGAMASGNYTILINCLQGNHTKNPRDIRMLEVDTKQGEGVMRDPWENAYQVALDTDYDGNIDDTTNGPFEKVYSGIAVWSGGPDKVDGRGSTSSDDVTSWR